MSVSSPATPQVAVLTDALGRPLRSLRISAIDRCDLRCHYCMPEEHYTWLPHQDILSFAEIEQIAAVFTELGVRKLRLTGGEPLLRPNLEDLVGRLSRNPLIDDMALTTNATGLEKCALSLKQAGLHRVTASLDSLRPERFEQLTRRRTLDWVVAGIRAAAAAGFRSLKINCVIVRGLNDDELVDLIEFGREVHGEVRFIEYMDVGGATRWSPDKVVSRGEIVARLQAHYGRVEEDGQQGTAPAERFRLPDGTCFGIVASVTAPFCRSCDRSRLTADGMWFLCLYAREGVDLRRFVREGSPEEMGQLIRRVWQGRANRGGEERAADPQRGVLFRLEDLQKDPHREMHTRGG